jgi:hypothetical protein
VPVGIKLATFYFTAMFVHGAKKRLPKETSLQTDESRIALERYDEISELLRAVTTEITVFWDIPPCSLVEINRRFGGPFCHSLNGKKEKPENGNITLI